MFFDADAHIDENVDTWSYFPESLSDLKPAELDFVPEQMPKFLSAQGPRKEKGARALFVDGRIFFRPNRSDEQTQTTVDTRELRDIPSRLRHMDELGIETQVLYPTILNSEVTERPEVQVAICESYNRWIADRCSGSNGRLRWLALLPLLSMPDALQELRRVKEAGAVGIAKRAYECGERRAGATYFHSMYELAQELDLPICMHVGQPFGVSPNLTLTRRPIRGDFYVQDAFLSLVISGSVKKFPRLRFGFIEAGASWLPNLLYSCNTVDSHRGASSVVQGSKPLDEKSLQASCYENFLEESNFFVTCEAPENLPIIIDQVGDNSLLVGTDYGHSDRSSILHGHREIMERTDITNETAIKLTETNGRRLYGL